MQGNVYIRYSALFDEQVVPLTTLKKQLRRFNLSNALFHVSRMNVLLGIQRMLREGREAMQKLQGQFIANYIDDEIALKADQLSGITSRDELQKQ